MIQIKKLLLVTMIASLGSMLYGMEKESLLLQLPSELKREIASLLLEKELGYNYKLFRKIDIGIEVRWIVFSPDGKIILTNSKDRKIAALRDVDSGELLQEFRGHTDYIYSVAFSPDGKTILTGSADATARLWDVETGKQLQEFKQPYNPIWGGAPYVTSVAFSPDGKTILTGGVDRHIRQWSVETGEQLKVFWDMGEGTVDLVAFSPDGKTIFAGIGRGVELWDVATGKVFKGFSNYRTKNGRYTSRAVSPDGKTVFIGDNGVSLLWDVESGNNPKEFKQTVSVVSVTFSPNGKTILTGSLDGTAQLRDVESYELLKELTGHTKAVLSVAFSKDREVIATGSSDKTVILYKRFKESPEETKERLEKSMPSAEKEYQEKSKFLLKPASNTNNNGY